MLLERLTRLITPVLLIPFALTTPGTAVRGIETGVTRQQTAQPAPDQPIFRATAGLGVVDAVVTDDKGRQITDLTIEDFELVVDGKRPALRHLVYVPLGAAARQAAAPQSLLLPAPAGPPAGGSAVPSPLRTAAGEDARIISVVVDDLGLSFESTYAVRTALKTFIDRQVQAGDLVAILRLAGGVGALQQFTNDRRLMHAAADRVQWTVFSRSGVSAFAPVARPDVLGAQTMSGSGTAEADDDETLEGARTSMLTMASLDALDYVVRGIANLPGRKAIVFFSEGFRLLPNARGMQSGADRRAWDAFTRLMDRANRAGVVVYTIDPRGLVSGRMTAEDDPQGRPAPAPGAAEMPAADTPSGDGRRGFLMDSQEALRFVASQTGGFAFLNNNDLNIGLERVLLDLSGYYLIGYDAPGDENRRWEPGRISVRVKRPGLRVRARGGLFGPATGRTPEPQQGDRLLLAALSPFGASDIPLRLTALFAYEAARGPFVRALLFIDPNAVRFTPDGAGRHEADLEIVQIVTGDNGAVVGAWRRTVSCSLTDDQLREARKMGLVYNTHLFVKKHGAYQVRVAVHDRSGAALGSASQFIEVPKVGGGRLALSGLIMRAASTAGASLTPGVARSEPAETLGLASDALGEPTVRIFEPGTNVVYVYEIYDGVRRAPAEPLLVTTALLRDGKLVVQDAPSPLSARPLQQGVRVVPVAGRLSLTRAVPRGTYTLQVSVAAGSKRRTAHQWTDFEVR